MFFGASWNPKLALPEKLRAGCARPRQRHHHVIQDLRPAPSFLDPNALIVPMFRAAFGIAGGGGRKSVGVDAERTITPLLRVPAGQPGHHRRARKILRRHLADRVIQRGIRRRVVGHAEFRPRRSTVTSGSFTTRRIVSRNCCGSSPGSRRTSRFAHASGGITLVRSEPPNLVREMVLRSRKFRDSSWITFS